ncbi:DNA-binding response OmpR family regulator [Kribbella sp. VKM Ac-2527]|uniref:DNA-binding response OmpR family regulator n=1 Tax=Kribbella caucasensis TaxID=2512215 RepID=A0A4R6K791_9ACTN|nr:response regulator transcription factor [Kribbella sp. VKM Ac-2527]TDO44211.1 DNA-binding response OmpR family regulator [Kribbella sp. VKM Ac-2527]
MTAPMMNTRESHSQHVRTRRRSAHPAHRKLQFRVSLLVVDHGDEVDELLAAAVAQPMEVHVCTDAAEALLHVGRLCPDVVLLGPCGGRLDPIEFLTIVRTDDPQQPVIVGADVGGSEFTSRASDAGASAVIPRPYRVRELLALINSLAPVPNQVDLRPLALDLGRLRVDGAVPQMWLDGRQIELPPMEFLLLRFFAERPGELVTRQEVLDAVWGKGVAVRSNTLNVHIMRLRKRLSDDERSPHWIKVIRGLGYQFKVPPSPRVAAEAPAVDQKFAQ